MHEIASILSKREKEIENEKKIYNTTIGYFRVPSIRVYVYQIFSVTGCVKIQMCEAGFFFFLSNRIHHRIHRRKMRGSRVRLSNFLMLYNRVCLCIRCKLYIIYMYIYFYIFLCPIFLKKKKAKNSKCVRAQTLFGSAHNYLLLTHMTHTRTHI